MKIPCYRKSCKGTYLKVEFKILNNGHLEMKIHFQIILFNSHKDLAILLKSLDSLSIGTHKIYIHFIDLSESDKEFNNVKNIIEKQENGKIELFLEREKNCGFGQGHNNLYRKWKEEYEDCFILLNPDSILHFDLIKNIDKYLNALKNENWGLLELAQFPSEHPKYYNPLSLETNWASGAGLIIRKKAFEKVGMFDENIFMYGEDVDLSIRMRIKDYKVLHLPEAKFTHLTKDTDVSRESEFTRIHKQASELYLRYKFAKDRDVRKYMSLIGEIDPHYQEILIKYNVMKKNLSGRTYYNKFVDKNQDYTNFRWSL